VLAEKRTTDIGYDGLVLCDGGSVDPLRYDERRRDTPVNEGRDLRDAALFDAFFLYGKPVLGVGRGCSFINVRLGGSLRRSLTVAQQRLHLGEGGRAVHPIILSPESYLYKIYTPTVRPLRVLSRHNDALRELGRELYSVARSEDGLVEAIVHRRLPVYGVQFSPEEMLPAAGHTLPLTAPDDGTPLFTWFLRRCAEIRTSPLTPSAAGRFSRS
jgi:putative glutamine amidotransferase